MSVAAARAYTSGVPEVPASLDVRHRASIGSALVRVDELDSLPPLEPLIAGYLHRDTLAMLYGPSGSGKTFLALGCGLHVATGTWWEGREVRAAPVLYIAAEGVRMIGQRVEAWSRHHNTRQFADYQPMHLHPGAVNLFDAAQARDLAEVCAELEVGLVVIDTLARCSAGAEENSARDMGRVIEACDAIRTATGACVLLVHHSGKDAAQGARGSSVLRAAMDTEISLDAAGRLAVTKAKDFAPPAPMTMRLREVEPSCVLTTAASSTDAEELTGAQVAVLEVLGSIDAGDGVATTVWRDIAMAGEVRPAVSKSSFYTAHRALVESNAVQNIGTDRSPRWTLQTKGIAA